jgi:hypothetical protein
MPVLWDHRCSHPRASLGMAPMVALRRSRPFVVKPATPLSLLGATPLVPSENSLSPDRNGADLALAEGLDASAAERVFGYRQATITTWLTRAGEYAQTLHERSFCHLRLPHLQLDELRTRLRCSTHVLWLWLAIDPLTRDSSRAPSRPPHTKCGTHSHPLPATALGRLSASHSSPVMG